MTYKQSMKYVCAIFTIAQHHNLSCKLKECAFFPEKIEFIGHDLSKIGNSPASSKDELIKHRKIPQTP